MIPSTLKWANWELVKVLQNSKSTILARWGERQIQKPSFNKKVSSAGISHFPSMPTTIFCCSENNVQKLNNLDFFFLSKGTNRTYEGFTKRSSSVLLPILVAALLSALFLIVLLFAVKLWKAHVVWKRGKTLVLNKHILQLFFIYLLLEFYTTF